MHLLGNFQSNYYSNVYKQQLLNLNFYYYRVIDGVSRFKIEIEMRDQAASKIWKREQLSRLTASNFDHIYKIQQSTSCKNTIYYILYNNFTCK